MYRYVLKRVRETIEFGVNVRKSYACNIKNDGNQQQQQQHKKCEKTVANSQFLPADSIKYSSNYEDFKKRYNCRHPNNCNNFINAITWVNKYHYEDMALNLF